MWLSKYWFYFVIAFAWAVEAYRNRRKKLERIAYWREKQPEAYSGDSSIKPILTILEPEHFSQAALKRLDEHFRLETHVVGLEPLVDWSAEVLWVRLGRVNVERFPNLRLLCSNCTDVSHLPLEECKQRNIEVLSLKGIEGLDTVHATAEHTIGLMLQALRHQCDRSSGKIGRELHGKSVWLVGIQGRIAWQVYDVLRGFGANADGDDIKAARRYPHFVSEADIVSIHADLNETSKGMVNAEFLSKLKSGCILVNTARHAIVDDEAILEWLERDKEAIYAHDFDNELRIDDEPSSSALNRIIGTPHIGGWTLESLHKTEELLAERVIEWSHSHAATC